MNYPVFLRHDYSERWNSSAENEELSVDPTYLGEIWRKVLLKKSKLMKITEVRFRDNIFNDIWQYLIFYYNIFCNSPSH